MKLMKVMTEDGVFFCDTYAIIEIIGGNTGYKKYLGSTLITGELNLMELYYAFLRDYGKETAEKYFDLWARFALTIPRASVKLAMEFRLANRKDNLSYVDCIGYVFALQNGIKFLTGDMKFRDREGVEFAK